MVLGIFQVSLNKTVNFFNLYPVSFMVEPVALKSRAVLKVSLYITLVYNLSLMLYETKFPAVTLRYGFCF